MGLFFLWLFATIALWIPVVHGLRKTSADANAPQGPAAIAAVFAAIPPTVIFLVSAFVLLQASPTVQFNAGSSYRFRLWSFWIDAWPVVYSLSGILSITYLGWVGLAFAIGREKWLRCAVAFAFLSSVFAWLLLRHAFPSA